MASTLLLDRTTWDLVLDASGNIASATEPYSLAQDAASAIKTFLGECYWDTTVGIPYLTAIFTGVPPSVTALKQMFINAALTVPDVVSAQCFLVEATGRIITGQIQVTSASTGQTSSAEFSATNPQGVG
jgi:hypothetical protein